MYALSLISLTGNIGERNQGTFLQQPLLPTASFPCRKAGHRSELIPNSVHQLRPGKIYFKKILLFQNIA